MHGNAAAPGDEADDVVSGYRRSCTNAGSLIEQDDRLVDVEWAPGFDSTFVVSIQVEALDRHGLLADTTQVLSEQDATILSASTTTTQEKTAVEQFMIEISDPEVLDRVLVNKLVYDFREPRRGEIIVFKAPQDWQSGTEGEDFIKRIIGVGGDRVTCCDAQGRMMVNGHAFDEPFIYTDADGNQDKAADEDFDITVPAGRGPASV